MSCTLVIKLMLSSDTTLQPELLITHILGQLFRYSNLVSRGHTSLAEQREDGEGGWVRKTIANRSYTGAQGLIELTLASDSALLCSST